MPLGQTKDADLVLASMAWDRDAFSEIVGRYQSLVCSLAFSATGSLGQSEDLAQETFIVAWKHLGRLRQREKLRAWLCGIARNRINHFLRHEGHQPLCQAEPLEHIAEEQSPEPAPAQQAISNEELDLLWRKGSSTRCRPPSARWKKQRNRPRNWPRIRRAWRPTRKACAVRWRRSSRPLPKERRRSIW